MPSPKMTIEVSPAGRVTFLHVSGDLDVATGEELRRQIGRWSRCGRAEVALDLVDVRFVDASGVHALTRAQEDGNYFRIWRSSRVVERLLGLLGQRHLAN